MNEDVTKIYDSFVGELTEWADKGVLPKSGNQDTAFYLELQQKRLQERNIRAVYRFGERKGHEKKSQSHICWRAQDPNYTVMMVSNDFSKEARYFRGRDCLYKEKKDTLLYQVITYLREGSMSGEEQYCCPNCSAISSVKSLLSGCPYCGTRFRMTDLFPKVTNFFYSDFEISYNTIRGSKLAGAGLAAAMILVGMMRAPTYADRVQIFLSGLFMVPFFSFIGYLMLAIVMMIYSIIHGMADAPRYFGGNRARKKITAFLREYDSSFSYDYFVSKMVSLLKIILYSGDRENLAVCKAKVEDTAFRDIIDIAYQGTITLNSCQMEGKYCHLDINLYLSNIHDGGRRIYKRNDVFRMKVCKDISKPQNYGFSIRKIQCGGCGGSFDAAREKYCPYCGREYDMMEDDWVVLELAQIK